MSSAHGATTPAAIPGCSLDEFQLGAQLQRYRRLARHASSVRRLTGEVVVDFQDDVPPGLMEHTLGVERRCCPFIHTAYDSEHRQLTLTIENVDQDPRLDSLYHALRPDTDLPRDGGVERRPSAVDPIASDEPSSGACCDPSVLASCCPPQGKDECCGTMTAAPPGRCGCQA